MFYPISNEPVGRRWVSVLQTGRSLGSLEATEHAVTLLGVRTCFPPLGAIVPFFLHPPPKPARSGTPYQGEERQYLHTVPWTLVMQNVRRRRERLGALVRRTRPASEWPCSWRERFQISLGYSGPSGHCAREDILDAQR